MQSCVRGSTIFEKNKKKMRQKEKLTRARARVSTIFVNPSILEPPKRIEFLSPIKHPVKAVLRSNIYEVPLIYVIQTKFLALSKAKSRTITHSADEYHFRELRFLFGSHISTFLSALEETSFGSVGWKSTE